MTLESEVVQKLNFDESLTPVESGAVTHLGLCPVMERIVAREPCRSTPGCRQLVRT